MKANKTAGKLVGSIAGKMVQLGSNMNYPNILKVIGSDSIVGYWILDDENNVAFDQNKLCDANYVGSKTLITSGIWGKKSTSFKGGSLNLYSSNFATRFNPNEGYCQFAIKETGLSGYILRLGDSSSNYIQVRYDSGTIAIYYYGGGSYKSVKSIKTNAKYSNLGFSWSKTSGKLCVYMDGIKIREVSGIAAYSGTISSANQYFMASTNGTSATVGKACHLLIMNRVPSNLELLAINRNITGIVCFEGDSRSNTKSWIENTLNYQNSDDTFAFNKYSFVNPAISGSTTNNLIARATTTNALIQAGKKNILILLIGVNDGDVVSAETTYYRIKNYCIAAKAAGWKKIIICTEIDAQTRPLWHTTQYQNLNALLRADHSFADALADLGARTELQDASNTTYFSGDLIHPNDTGYSVFTEVIGPVLKSLM